MGGRTLSSLCYSMLKHSLCIVQGCHPVMRLLPEHTETGLLSGRGPVFIAPCVLALQVLECDHLEKLQAIPEFTVFSHKDESTSNSLEICADS